MKYTINVNGKGAESFIHELTEEQYETLQDSGVEEKLMDKDKICDILGLDLLDTEYIINGIYPDDYNIIVKDESGEVVFESEEYFEFEEYIDEYKFNETHYLLVEDCREGHFFNYTLETDDDFNPEMLIANLVEFLDGCSELITDIKYKDHEMFKYFGNTSRSKSFNYILY